MHHPWLSLPTISFPFVYRISSCTFSLGSKVIVPAAYCLGSCRGPGQRNTDHCQCQVSYQCHSVPKHSSHRMPCVCFPWSEGYQHLRCSLAQYCVCAAPCTLLPKGACDNVVSPCPSLDTLRSAGPSILIWVSTCSPLGSCTLLGDGLDFWLGNGLGPRPGAA